MKLWKKWQKRLNCYTQEYTHLELGLSEQIRKQPHIFPHSGIALRTLSFVKNYILCDAKILNTNFSEESEIRIFCGNNGNEILNLKKIFDVYSENKTKNIQKISVGRLNVGNSQIELPPKLIFIKVLFLLPIILVSYVILLPFSLGHLKFSFDRLLIGISYYIYFKTIFLNRFSSHCSIKIFISNHNNPISAALLHAASEYKNISTYYVEHCKYVQNWPKINTDKYIVCFPHSLNEIPSYWNRSNMLYFSQNSPVELRKTVMFGNYIGLAICPIDDMTYLFNIIKFLQANFKINILVRPHPSLTEKQFSIIGKMFKDVIIMKPSVYPLNDFLEQCSLLLVSDSSIYFDAWSRGVLPLKVQLSSHNSEYTVKNDCYYGLQREDVKLIDLIKRHIDGSLRDHVRYQYFDEYGAASSKLAPFFVD
jgi:hypothetical protein